VQIVDVRLELVQSRQRSLSRTLNLMIQLTPSSVTVGLARFDANPRGKVASSIYRGYPTVRTLTRGAWLGSGVRCPASLGGVRGQKAGMDEMPGQDAPGGRVRDPEHHARP
jgi:hypothetical protein